MTVEVVEEASIAITVEERNYSVVIASEEGGDDVVLQAPAETTIIEVVEPGKVGPQGPEGPQGAKGDSGGAFEYVRESPSRSWVIFHDLGYKPAGIHVTRSDGTQVDPLVHHASDNLCVLSFFDPEVGTAYIS